MTTYFVGSYYEVTAGVATKYYYAGSQRIAMRRNGTLYYMFSDHLGSTSVTTDSAGNVISELRYKPWGEVRYAGATTPTQYQFTGQFSYESDFGLYFYQSRFYDPSLGRFSQPDSIIPEQSQGGQAWDRFAYTNNNPVRYTDPSGHEICMDDGNCKKTFTPEMVLAKYGVKLENGSKTWTLKDKLAVLRGVVDAAGHLGARIGDTAVNAFRDVFNTSSTPMVFLMGNTGSQFTNDGTGGNKYCDIGGGGCNVGATRYKDTGQLVNLIKFESLSPVFFRARNNVVHELGHAFYNILGKPELSSLDGSLSRDALIRNQTIGGKEVLEWEQHPHADGSELFADTFLAWTYNAWNTDPSLSVALAVDNAQGAMNAIPLP